MVSMKISLFFLLPFLLHAQSVDTSVFDSNSKIKSSEDKKASDVECRCVCDKKLSKERSIQEAIDFYKNSKYHTFEKKD